MKRTLKIIIPVLLVLALVAAAAWFLLFYRPDLTGGFFVNYAERMMEDERYDRAITSYSLAWKLQPKREDIARDLADATLDYKKDRRKGKYNPYLAAGMEDPAHFEDHLVLAMGRCTTYFEHLPLVQDKSILDNILYGGVWIKFPKKKETEESHDRRSL